MTASLFDLSGKTAFVSGASRGLGKGFALALARAGADVVISSRSGEGPLLQTQAEIQSMGRQAWAVSLDVRKEESIREATALAWERAGKIDVLVNNAGCNVRKPALEVTWDDWNLVLETNLRGLFFLAQAHAAMMIPRKYGRIINMGSVTCAVSYTHLTLPTIYSV